jgi:hypothetical protein
MDKLVNLKIQKLLQEYSFLLSDDEYKTELINTYKSEFLSNIQTKNKKEPEIEKNEEPLQIDLVEKQKPTAPENIVAKCKKIYRDIVKLTHPDKVTSEDLIELYIKAKDAYAEYNLFDLYMIGIKLNLKIFLESEDMDTLIKLIDDKKTKLDTIEKSWLWLWVMSKTEDEKNSVVDKFIELNKESL